MYCMKNSKMGRVCPENKTIGVWFSLVFHLSCNKCEL